MSTAAGCTASASASTTVAPSTSTESASATSRSVSARVAFTVNADPAGTDAASSAPSKVTVSVAPFTDAEEYAGGVLFVAVWLPNAGASLPDRSRTWSCPETLTGVYLTSTAWSCVTALARFPVTVRPATTRSFPAPGGINRAEPSTKTPNALWSGILVSSSASSKVTVSVRPFTDADANAGPVVSTGVPLSAVCAAKSGTGCCARSASRSFAPVAGAV